MASPLRKWMRKNDFYDVDIEKLLTELGIENPPDDFKSFTQSNWDDLVRRGKVERFKELKDQASRNRLEAKFKKIEKVWRKQSGIKSTSIKKKGKKKKGGEKKDKSAPKNASGNEQQDLKKFLKKQGMWETTLYTHLCEAGVTSGDDFKDAISSNDDWDEIYRKVRVARTKDLKSNDARMRMEALMTKVEKHWRKQSGIKKTSQTKKTKKGSGKKAPKDKQNEEMSGKGAELKKWMRKEAVWEMSLYEELLKNGIEDPDSLAQLTENEFDEIVRTVRVERFKDLKDQASRNRCDKLLVGFEKKWRKVSGVKKTSIQD